MPSLHITWDIYPNGERYQTQIDKFEKSERSIVQLGFLIPPYSEFERNK